MSLTPAGKQVVDDLLPAVLRLISESVSSVTEDEIRVFWKVLREIENTLSRVAGDHMID